MRKFTLTIDFDTITPGQKMSLSTADGQFTIDFDYTDMICDDNDVKHHLSIMLSEHTSAEHERKLVVASQGQIERLAGPIAFGGISPDIANHITKSS
jgi:hypothetical protein